MTQETRDRGESMFNVIVDWGKKYISDEKLEEDTGTF